MRAKQVAAGIGARAPSTGVDVIAVPDVDVVVVMSWAPTHEEFVLASIGAGKRPPSVHLRSEARRSVGMLVDSS